MTGITTLWLWKVQACGCGNLGAHVFLLGVSGIQVSGSRGAAPSHMYPLSCACMWTHVCTHLQTCLFICMSSAPSLNYASVLSPVPAFLTYARRPVHAEQPLTGALVWECPEFQSWPLPRSSTCHSVLKSGQHMSEAAVGVRRELSAILSAPPPPPVPSVALISPCPLFQGNDQVRFELTCYSLAPQIKVRCGSCLCWTSGAGHRRPGK